ncbi:MAG: HlyD family efflux transporter periplasmic adaptor subunit [Peptostreptococcaceae bacterium]
MKRVKLKYNKIILGCILIYIISNVIIMVMKNNIDTLVLENQTIQESFKKKGLIIRDEYLINANMDGNIEYCVKEDSRVKKDDQIAYIYNENVNKSDKEKLNSLQTDISNIQVGNTKVVKSDVEKINKNISDISLGIQKKILDDNIDIHKEIENINFLIKDRNHLINSDFNDKSLKNKQSQAKEVSDLINKNTETFRAENSGSISYQFDGNEDNFNFDKISEIKTMDIESIESKYMDIKKDTIVKKGEPVARVINNSKQYVAISCSDDEVEKMEIGQEVILSSKIEKINTNVYDIYKDGSNYIVILEISEQNVEIYDTRVQEFDIIYKSIEGLKVPKNAILKVDDKQGVYVVSETGDAKFVEVKGTLYESEEYIIIDHYKNDIKGIDTVSIYDEIILNPKFKKGFYLK